MKIKLLIAIGDSDYVEHLSKNLSKKHADTFEVGICSSADRLHGLLNSNRFDIVLIDTSFASNANLTSVRLPIIMWDQSEDSAEEYKDLVTIRKYNQISSIVGSILESYAKIGASISNYTTERAHITAVWSPHGGTGKTTVALAYAARKVLGGKRVIYLNMESFSSTAVYFSENGKSISSVFEKLDSNVQMLLMGICRQDSGSGITYFCTPNNYDDINILKASDIEILINACAKETDELVIDLSSQWDERIQKTFELSDNILLVCDSSATARVKLNQFINQHNVAQQTQTKSVIVNNKGAKIKDLSDYRTIQLPYVQSSDPISVYKTLSGNSFEW